MNRALHRRLSSEGEVLPGNALPIGGAHQSGDGVNFVLFSRHATRVRLELYQMLTIHLR